ncbi:MAG: type II modification methylase [Ectothiorhodospiraceae bacterium AqS1]|nr:type II modification methylase [Ectothiorhodospiraceae bacterium AqS1]
MTQRQKTFGFMERQEPMSAAGAAAPAGYKGLYGFHKYWGKKPHEPLAYVIERLTKPGQLVLDPFVGSGTVAREALLRSRRFIGFDINPVAIALTRMLVHPPSVEDVRAAISDVENKVKDRISDSYRLSDGEVAAHYLWNEDRITQVWIRGAKGKTRRESKPTPYDRKLSERYSRYRSRFARSPRFFTNGRINSAPEMSLDDIMTGRAQRNLDILIEAIDDLPHGLRTPLMLCLTAASGQMTKMVFAITDRGKTSGEKTSKIEVGSWVIGYWRPKVHFEVNVWNCFERRTSKLIRAIEDGDPLGSTKISDTAEGVLENLAQTYLFCGDCRQKMESLPDRSVDLIITDPPHGDRVPYLELSEFWNGILRKEVDFDREIVFSNAKERGKNADSYVAAMTEFFDDTPRILSPSGFLVVLFNARQRKQWAALRNLCNGSKDRKRGSLNYIGQFPCAYSAGSVVQDNRKKSLKSDYALVFAKRNVNESSSRGLGDLYMIPGWSDELPDQMNGEYLCRPRPKVFQDIDRVAAPDGFA